MNLRYSTDADVGFWVVEMINITLIERGEEKRREGKKEERCRWCRVLVFVTAIMGDAH
jgi:hypothetical protein